MNLSSVLSNASIPVIRLSVWVMFACPVFPAHAEPDWPCAASPAVASIQLGDVSVDPGVPNGTKLGSPVSVSVTFDCSETILGDYPPNETIQVGNLAPTDSTYAAPDGGILFITSVPGIGVELTAEPNQASDGENGPGGELPGDRKGWGLGSMCPGGDPEGMPTPCNTDGYTLTATFTAQLVKVGPVTGSGTVEIPVAAQFTNYSYGYFDSAPYHSRLEILPVHITVSTCLIDSDPTEVTLPEVVASQITGSGQAGETPFSVRLTCPSFGTGAQVVMTLDSNDKVASIPGLIAATPGSNYATDVGVQILDGNGDEITFGTPLPPRVIDADIVDIPLRARYYQTGPAVGGGLVKATATYTLTYQ